MAVSVKKAILNQLRENKLSHAYLIETNNLFELEKDLKTILKTIVCQNDELYCDNCQQCHFIDNDCHPNIIKIVPDGQNIKISQIEDLQKRFSTKAFFGKYNIYIISEANKLNLMAANALLKFLEEPADNIIGFLLTTKRDLVLPTIVSRCQLFVENYKENEENENLKKNALELLNISKSIDGILQIKAFLANLDEKNDLKPIFSFLLQEELKDNNKVDLKKVKIYHRFLEKIKYNVNIEILLEDFIIEMSDVT